MDSDERDKTIVAFASFLWLVLMTIWAGFIVHDMGRIAAALDRAYPHPAADRPGPPPVVGRDGGE